MNTKRFVMVSSAAAAGVACVLVCVSCKRGGEISNFDRDVSGGDLTSAEGGATDQGVQVIREDLGDSNSKSHDVPELVSSAGHHDSSYRIAELFDKYQGDELERAITTEVLHFETSDWAEMLEFVSNLPPGDVFGAALGTAIKRLVSENQGLWPGDSARLRELLQPKQFERLAEAFGSAQGSKGGDAKLLDKTLSSSSLSEQDKIRYASAFMRAMAPEEIGKLKAYVLELDSFPVFARVLPYFSGVISPDQIRSSIVELHSEAGSAGQLDGDYAYYVGSYYGAEGATPPQDVIDLFPPSGQRALMAEYFYQTARTDLNAALSELAEFPASPQKDAAIMRLYSMIAEYDQQAASAWVQEIQSPELRESMSLGED